MTDETQIGTPRVKTGDEAPEEDDKEHDVTRTRRTAGT